MNTVIPTKPLAGKAYGHIPHLPGSRMGAGDHYCHEGQAAIATQKPRDLRDFVTVTVKLDGSCVAVARINGAIVPLMRAGHIATTSKYEQHHLFAHWVRQNEVRFLQALNDGERFVGEWLAQALGTRYNLIHEPFVPFDLIGSSGRLPYLETMERVQSIGLPSPTLIAARPLSIPAVIDLLSVPHHGEIDPVEGAVWRVERDGEFDFICKWVRPDKQDGKYLPEISGEAPVWNWRPRALDKS